jgi:hypothetical protein
MRRRLGLLTAVCVGMGTFLPPRSAEIPTHSFPEVEKVIQGLIKRAEADPKFDREFESRYRFTHTKTREERNPKRMLKKRESERTVHEPESAPTLAENWPGDAAAAVTGGAGEVGSKADKRGRANTRGDVVLTEALMRRFEFTIRAREWVAGRTALKMDFRPVVRELPAKSLMDRFINRTAGTIWVDETDFTISKAMFWLTERLNLGGGILGSVSAFDCRFERRRVEDKIWYTPELEWHVECREFLVNKIIEFQETREDVRKVR